MNYLQDFTSQNRKPKGAFCPATAGLLAPKKTIEESHVVVVEDDPETRSLLCDYLQARGFNTIIYSDATQALNDIKDGLPHLEDVSVDDVGAIVSDYSMPNMNGIEFMRELREAGVDTKMILITAYCSRVTEHFALKSGAHAFFAKPFSLNELSEKVAECITD